MKSSEYKKESDCFFRVFPKGYANKKPSKTTGTKWICVSYMNRLNKSNMQHIEKNNNGKWMIFAETKHIDFYWDKIKKATKEGLLSSCKVSTRHKDTEKHSGEHVICVYCDLSEAEHYRDILYGIGISHRIGFKLNSTSAQNKYRINGDTKISTLYI